MTPNFLHSYWMNTLDRVEPVKPIEKSAYILIDNVAGFTVYQNICIKQDFHTEINDIRHLI